MQRWMGWWGIFLILLGALIAAPGTGAQEIDTDGYLINGGFEGEFYPVGEGQVAVGWQRVHLKGEPNWMSTCTFADAGPNCDQGWVEKIEGKNSMILSSEDLGVGQPFETVLYQTVEGLTAGQPYSFSGWTLKMWGGSANQQPPEDPYAFGSWIGIDPTGGEDPDAPTVIWSPVHWESNAGNRSGFKNQRVAATAEGEQMTVFIRLWLKWQRDHSQAIVDGWELFDAPRATMKSRSGYVASPRLEWEGTLPEGLQGLGNYALFYEVQQQQADGSWAVVITELREEHMELALAEGKPTRLRVLPYSYQPREEAPRHWPPSTHVGLPTDVIELTLDQTGPEASMVPPERWLDVQPFAILWGGHDRGSGVASYDVAYRRVGDDPAWQEWLTNTPATMATFGEGESPVPLVAGEEWEFRVRARDAVGNLGEWSRPVRVGLARARLQGRLLAANGQPLVGARIVAEGYPFSDPPTIGILGNYLVPLADPISQTLSFLDIEGNRRLPDTTITVEGPEMERDWYLPPASSAVTNGHFEERDGWSGEWHQVAEGASGRHAAHLAAGATISQTVEVAPGNVLSLTWRGTSAAARLQVQLGEVSWELPLDEAGGWQHWHQEITAEGRQMLLLRPIEGELHLDEVAIGPPDPVPHYLFLPLSPR